VFIQSSDGPGATTKTVGRDCGNFSSAMAIRMECVHLRIHRSRLDVVELAKSNLDNGNARREPTSLVCGL